jgi:hypothetical protein
MKLLSCILLCVPLLINGKPLENNLNLIRDNCEVVRPKIIDNYNISCISCELGISIIKYEYQLNNLNQTVNIMGELCNSTILQPYQNLTKECNIIFNNIPTIIKQLDINHTVSQICSKLYLC